MVAVHILYTTQNLGLFETFFFYGLENVDYQDAYRLPGAKMQEKLMLLNGNSLGITTRMQTYRQRKATVKNYESM